MERSVDELKEALRSSGLRATSARVAVLRCLLDATAPMSHAEVCGRLQHLGFDRATVYRNLTDLTDAGLASRTDLGDHLWRFEAVREAHEEGAVHPHFVCQECGVVECLPEQAVDVRPLRGAPRALGSPALEIQLRGVCNACD